MDEAFGFGLRILHGKLRLFQAKWVDPVYPHHHCRPLSSYKADGGLRRFLSSSFGLRDELCEDRLSSLAYGCPKAMEPLLRLSASLSRSEVPLGTSALGFSPNLFSCRVHIPRPKAWVVWKRGLHGRGSSHTSRRELGAASSHARKFPARKTTRAQNVVSEVGLRSRNAQVFL